MNVNPVTEQDIIKHVQSTGRYVPKLRDQPYHAHWNGKAYYAADIRQLVIQICEKEGIKTE